MSGISIFFPVYNDEHTIEDMVHKAVKTAESFTDDYEIIMINDASTDNSGKICDGLARENERVKVIHNARNMDYGGVLKSGFCHSSKELVFYTDGDGQYDIGDLNKLLPLISKNDAVIGYKIKRSDPFSRIIIGNIYNFIVTGMFNLKVKDVTCDFRLFRREAVKSINLCSNSGFICVELMKEIQDRGYRVAEVAVGHYPRKFGRSQAFQIKKICRMLADLAAYAFRK